jgi:hypothetical protein
VFGTTGVNVDDDNAEEIEGLVSVVLSQWLGKGWQSIEIQQYRMFRNKS